jgi:hypothetical protein
MVLKKVRDAGEDIKLNRQFRHMELVDRIQIKAPLRGNRTLALKIRKQFLERLSRS